MFLFRMDRWNIAFNGSHSHQYILYDLTTAQVNFLIVCTFLKLSWPLSTLLLFDTMKNLFKSQKGKLKHEHYLHSQSSRPVKQKKRSSKYYCFGFGNVKVYTVLGDKFCVLRVLHPKQISAKRNQFPLVTLLQGLYFISICRFYCTRTVAHKLFSHDFDVSHKVNWHLSLRRIALTCRLLCPSLLRSCF